MGVIISILVLGLIILIHEFGHFVMAKLFKVPVREFSLGMGPRIWSRVYKNTRFSIKSFPFGGSCAMIGEDPAGSGDMSEDPDVKIDKDGLLDYDGVKFTKEEIENNNFSVIKPYKKFLICLAGPLFNFILAFVCAIFLVINTGFDAPVIFEVSEGMAATEGTPYSLKSGDKIIGLEIPGEKEDISSYRDIAIFMQLNNDDIIKNKYPLVINFIRNNEKLRTVVYPTVEEGRALIGIKFSNDTIKPTNVIDVIKMAGYEVYFYIDTTIMSLRLLIRGKLGTKDISGPVGTVAVMGSAINEAKTDSILAMILTILSLMALISANLGVMNLLPIPALDGGRIVFAAIEMIIGKPLNKDFEAIANAITMILLLIFMVWIFGMDIYKLIYHG